MAHWLRGAMWNAEKTREQAFQRGEKSGCRI
jgi:hypothetical protein